MVNSSMVGILLCFVSIWTRLDVVRTNSIALLDPEQQPSAHRLLMQRSQRLQQEPGIRLYVTPRRATIHYGGTVNIRCKARGGNTVADMPYIRFSMFFEPDTVLPLNPGIPGIRIESERASSNYSVARYNVAMQKLSIGDEMYNYMQYGENKFLCKAVNLNRDQERQMFVITKV